MYSDKPIYNLNVALRETGIKADVLRAWERRYGLPKPQRSHGGHRLYSERDIAIIKWLIARQNEGLSISSAVELFREKEALSQDPLEEAVQVEQPAPLTVFSNNLSLDMLRNAWLEACIGFKEPLAEQLLNQAFSLYPLEIVLSEIIQKGMRGLGDKWFDGEATVQQEHFTSALVLRRLETLIAATPPPIRSETILIANPSEEWHTITMVMLNLLLRRRGYHVVFLGANVPTGNLDETANNIKPDLVILASQHLSSAANLQKATQILSQKNVHVAYGGRVFNTIPALRKRIPGYFLGETIEESLSFIEQLIQNPKVVPNFDKTPSVYRILAQEFKEKRGLIESSLIEALKAKGAPVDYVTAANLHLGNQLTSALELGDVNFLANDMLWIKGYLEKQNVPSDQLDPYLRTYAESVQKSMNGHSVIFTNWVKSLRESEE
jgi:MerR family transcriptional regulator, light-induced transcriptional regulator